MIRNIKRLRSNVTSQPHLRNLERWERPVQRGDIPSLHRVLTGLDRESIEMREVSPNGRVALAARTLRGARDGRLMRRDQLDHAIRAACQIIGHEAVIIVGSQAILGTYSETQLPDEATMSVEVDILPIANGMRRRVSPT